jgi:hypothetical protein
MSMGTSLRSYSRGHTLVSMQDGVANATRYYHFDHQGTTQCLTNEAGVVTDRFASDAWGVEVKRTGNSINRHWYVGNGGYYVGRAAFYYVRRRNLSAALSAWLSPDPLAFRSSRRLLLQVVTRSATRMAQRGTSRIAVPRATYRHTYEYVRNDPTARIDATGLKIGNLFCDETELKRFTEGLNRACRLMGRLESDSSFYAEVSRCIANSGPKCENLKIEIGGSPTKSTMSTQCLRDACENPQIICGNSKCKRGPADDCPTTKPCALGGRVGSTCRINLCVDILGTGDCGSFGGGDDEILIHEMTHCCGIGPEKKGDDYPTCSDVIACCTMKIERNDPWDVCRHATES